MGLYKSKGIKQANQTLDRWFSIYIRLRDADSDGMVECVTCGHSGPWDDGFDAGHFVDYQRLATRWDEWNVHSQCKSCNLSANGKQYRHGEAIKDLHGEEIPDELIEKSQQEVEISKADRMKMARKYKQLAEEMAERKGIDL